MEFRYKNRSRYLYGLTFLIGLVSFSLVIYDLASALPVNALFLTISIPALLIGGIGLKYCLPDFKSTITLDDNGIALHSKRGNTFLKWADINTCEVNINQFLNPFEQYMLFGEQFQIIFSDGTSTIKVGSHLENMPSFVSFAKSKLGGIFNTAEIPLQFK